MPPLTSLPSVSINTPNSSLCTGCTAAVRSTLSVFGLVPLSELGSQVSATGAETPEEPPAAGLSSATRPVGPSEPIGAAAPVVGVEPGASAAPAVVEPLLEPIVPSGRLGSRVLDGFV